MRRATGITVIAAAAALGVTAAVVLGAEARPRGAGVAGSTSPGATTSAPVTRPSTPTRGSGTGTGAPTTPGSPTPSAPSVPATTDTYTQAELTGTPLTAANLFTLDDLERAGWVTGTVQIITRAGDGPGLAGTCQAQPLSTLPGGGDAVSASYHGRTTNAYESAATFTSQQEALAAYDSVVTWFRQCGDGTLPGHLGRKASIGPQVQVNLDTEFNRALWVTVGGDGFEGAAGVAVAGRRVALFYDEDKDPATRTVNSLMTAVSLRLTA